MNDHRFVETPEGVRDVVAALSAEPEFALDTQFHRERTYFPKVALMQVAWPGSIVLIDPLAVSLEPFTEVFGPDHLVVMHAAEQDLEVLDHATGTIPDRLFDTQLAAGFVGMSTPSLAALHDRQLGLRLPKGNRLTDWLRRPLSADQLDYAASDVAHLLEIASRLRTELTELGRLTWAEVECEELRTRPRGPRDPDDVWRRIKEAKHLRGTSVGVVAAVAAWRERRAIELDVPPRFVLSDLGVVGVAQRNPTTVDDFKGIRGLDEQQLKGDRGVELLAVVAEGRDLKPQRQRTKAWGEQRTIRPAVTLVSAWVSQLARDLDLDAALLGSRADIESLVRGDDDARLLSGWRAEAVGDAVQRLLDGDAALAFERGKGLVLEDRGG